MRTRIALALLISLAATGCHSAAAPDEPASAPLSAPVSQPAEDPVGSGSVTIPEGSGVRPAPNVTASPSPAEKPSPDASNAALASVDQTHPVALTWDGIDLRLPSAMTELVGFHESNHDGARDVQAYEGRVRHLVMESRERGTSPRGASDIVVHPDVELRAMVSGIVKRAGSYTLYCDKKDDFVVIEPDGRPGIEVKMLHLAGVQLRAGERVEAGVTVLAPRPTKLPFASQVDEHSASGWPHVHVEVVDSSIPDIPNGNSGSDDC
jgi:hypothetical protein